MDKKPAIAIIQARMSSKRLPGKVMLPLANKPVIHHIVDRAKLCKSVDKVIVATSIDKSDDSLAEYCIENKINCFRGSLNNVLSRYIILLKKYNYDYCVRITGDCPLIHPSFIDAQIEALRQFNGDIIWTEKQSPVLEGQGVISKNAMLNIYNNASDLDDLEHVGSKYILNKSEEFKFVGMQIPEKYYNYNYRITLDEKSDYEFLESIFAQSWNSNFIDLNEVLQWLDGLDETEIINKHIQHSLINEKLNNQRLILKPNLIGSYSWGDT